MEWQAVHRELGGCLVTEDAIPARTKNLERFHIGNHVAFAPVSSDKTRHEVNRSSDARPKRTRKGCAERPGISQHTEKFLCHVSHSKS